MGPEASRTGGRRTLAGLAAVALLGGVVLAPAAQYTDAGWTDAEAGAAQLTAGTLAPPQIQSPINPCSRALLGGDVLGVRWGFPSTDGTYSGFDVANSEWRVGDSEWQSMADATVGPDADGVYTTSFNRGLLDGLLGGLAEILLGGSFTVEVRTTDGATWASAGVSSVTYSAQPLQAPVCVIENGA